MAAKSVDAYTGRMNATLSRMRLALSVRVCLFALIESLKYVETDAGCALT